MSFYNKHFTGIGVDISEHHVRIAHLSVFGSVQKLIEIDLPEGLVQDEKIVHAEELRKIVNDRLNKEGLVNGGLRTTLLIPESRVFATGFLIPASKSKDAARLEAIDHAQKEIPIPFENAVAVVSRGARVNQQVRTTAYAIEQEVFQGLTQVFDPTHFGITAMEANSKAILRLFQRYGRKDLQVRDANTLVGLIDIGHAWATISLYMPDGSNLFSRTLSYQGVRGDTKDGSRLPKETVDFIHRTIDEVVVYFNEKKTKIGLFIFAGVEAEDDRFKKEGSFYQLGDVVRLGDQKKRAIHTYGAALGAALRSVHPYQYAYQHNFIHSP